MAFTSGNDINILQASDTANIGAGAGNDTYVLTPANMSAGQVINISDAQGANTLMLTAGITIVSSAMAADSLQLVISLAGGGTATINVLGANTFNYKLAGNGFDANSGVSYDYPQLINELGATTPPTAATPVVFGTPNADVNADGTIGATAPATSEFSIATATATVVEGNEGASTDVTVTITRTGDTANAASVDVNFGGTANAADFTATDPAPAGATVTFGAGESTKTITVSVKGDVEIEADENITMTLANASGSNTIKATAVSAQVTVTNDDSLGDTFVLTANVDAPPADTFTTFQAPQVFTPGGNDRINSLQDNDTLIGTGGTTDVLNATLGANGDTGDTNIMPTLSKIETVNVNFDFSNMVLDLQDSTGITSVNMMRVDALGGNAAIDNMTAVPTEMSVHNTSAQAGFLNFSFTDAAVRGTADASTMTLDNARMLGLSIQENAFLGTLDQGIEALTINSVGTANAVNTLFAQDLNTLTVTGAQDLRVANLVNGVVNGTQTEAVYSNAGFQNTAGTFDTLDASAFTGNLDVDVSVDMDANVEGTSGNNVDFTLTGGAGDDVFRVGTGLNRVGGATDNDTIDGGAGANTVRVFFGGNGGNANLVVDNGATVTNVQTLDMRYQGADFAATLIADTSVIGGLKNVVVRNESQIGAGAVTFQLNEMSDAVAANGGVTILHSTTGDNGLGNNTLDINLADAAGTGAAAETVVVTIADGINTDPTFRFTLDADGENAAGVIDAGAVENLTIRDTDSETNEVTVVKTLDHRGVVTLSGGVTGQSFVIANSFASTFGENPVGVGLADNRLEAATVDASGQRSDVLIALSANVTPQGHDQTVTGGTGDDTFDFRNFLNENDTVNGGEGTDRIRATFAANQTDPLELTSIETLRFAAVGGNQVIDLDNVAGVKTLEMIGSVEATATDGVLVATANVLTTELEGGVPTVSFNGIGTFDVGFDINFNGVTVVKSVGTNTYTGDADSVTLAFGNEGVDSAGADYATGAVTLNGVEALTVAVTDLVDAGGDGASVRIAGITSDELETITVSSSVATSTGVANTTDVNLGTVQGNALNNSITSVNANAVSGDFTAVLNSMGNNSTVTATGRGNHTIDLGNSFGSNISVTTERGNDTITGSVSSNVINAGNGNNVVDARGGNDVVTTGTGNDVISAGGDDDAVNAGAGNDLIRGGVGVDNLQGGDGNDTFVVVGQLNAVFNAAYTARNLLDTDADGVSRLFDLNEPVAVLPQVDLSANGVITSLQELTNLKASDDLEAGEIITGGAGVDTIAVYGLANFVGVNISAVENMLLKSHAIVTAAQASAFTSIAGVGVAAANQGSQLTIQGPGIVDLVNVNQWSGIQTINLINGAQLRLNDAEVAALLAGGLNAINVNALTQLIAEPGSSLGALLVKVSELTTGDDTINATSGMLETNPVIDALGGNDTLVVTDSVGPAGLNLAGGNIANVEKVTLTQGSLANVTIFNGAGVTVTSNAAATVTLGTGGQTFTGSAEADRVTSVGGNDTINTAAGADEITISGAGNVTVNTGNDDDFIIIANLTNADTINGDAGSDAVLVSNALVANALDNVTNVEAVLLFNTATLTTTDSLVAAGETFSLSALAGALSFNGSAETNGNFFIVGSSDADTIVGGGLDDTISGGAGNDTLTGGNGRDTFIFEKTAAANGADTITDFTSVDVLDLSGFVSPVTFSTSIVSTAGSIAAAQTNQVFYLKDIAGGLTADAVAKLFNPSAVAGDNMVVIVDNSTTSTTSIFYVDNGANSAVTTAEVQLVGTLTGFTQDMLSSNLALV